MIQTKSLRAALLNPTTSLSGNEGPSIFRGRNIVLRGSASGSPYFEIFPGNKDLNENYDLTANVLTGTLAFTANSTTVTGTATVFKTELHLGQHILAGTQVLQVKRVISDTSFECGRAPDTSESGLAGYRLPQMFEIDGKRGVLLTGSAIKLENGHRIVVGSGTYYENGALLPGDTLLATNQAQAMIYQAATEDFIVRDLGFDTAPPAPTVEMKTGGTKGMVEGNKASFMFSWWTGSPEGTDGYSNPCDPVKLDISNNPIQITSTLNQFRLDFTAAVAVAPANAKGFIIWCSQQGKQIQSISGGTVTTTSPNEGNYNTGPWFKYIHEIAFSDLSGNTYDFDYLDSELYTEVTGDNFKPPAAEFVCKVEGKPTYVSCFGPLSSITGEGTSPGNAVVVSKFGNVDGVPVEWAAYLTGTIVGWFEGVGRWFMMTSGSLDFIVSTGLFGQNSQGGATVELPIISRPYWKTGAANRYSIIIVDDTLYGRSGGRFFKSVGSGDENVKKYDFGSVMDDLARNMNDGYVLAGNAPTDTQIVFIHTAARKNTSGYWESDIHPYSLFNDAWLPTIVLSSTTRDMIVSGVATVDEKLEFLCGGRVSGGTFQTKTYRFAAGDASLTSMPAYLLWQISDDGEENRSKRIHFIRPQGKFSTGLTCGIYGTKPGGELIISDMEDGLNPIGGGNITFAASDEITHYLQEKTKIGGLADYTVRAEMNWDGTGMRDRLEEIVVGVSTHGRER